MTAVIFAISDGAWQAMGAIVVALLGLAGIWLGAVLSARGRGHEKVAQAASRSAGDSAEVATTAARQLEGTVSEVAYLRTKFDELQLAHEEEIVEREQERAERDAKAEALALEQQAIRHDLKNQLAECELRSAVQADQLASQSSMLLALTRLVTGQPVVIGGRRQTDPDIPGGTHG